MTFDNMTAPRFTDPLESMALCCIRMGDKKRAAAYYQQEIDILRTDWDIKYGSDVDRLKDKIKELQ